ncbi:MAG: hypothetical protein ACI9HK_003564 [Pirellulaceae bacterium]|jgi:hypothetical protein
MSITKSGIVAVTTQFRKTLPGKDHSQGPPTMRAFPVAAGSIHSLTYSFPPTSLGPVRWPKFTLAKEVKSLGIWLT